MDASFFVSISFLIFAWIFYKALWPNLINMIDEYIEAIKAKFSASANLLQQQENKKLHNQKLLQQLPVEIESLKQNSKHKLEMLTKALEKELSDKYIYRKNSLQQVTSRMLRHQRNTLQTMVAEETFKQVESDLKKDPDFANDYMLFASEQLKVQKHVHKME
jgi:F0F1-type ATP synthase membrane subunit b/b'